MAKIFLLLFTVLLSSFVSAASCTDSDKGPVNLKDVAEFIVVGGVTADDFKGKADACVRSESSDKKVDESDWLREYYCSGALALSKTFKCKDFGFDKCAHDDDGRGRCVGGKAKDVSKETVKAASAKPKVDFYCGTVPMKRSDAECYPPGKLCIKNRSAGECGKDCKCVIAGDSDEESEEAPEESNDVSEEKNEEKGEASLEIEVPPQDTGSKTPPKEAKKVEKKDSPVKQTVTLRVIAAISHGVKKAWGGLWGLFS